MSGLGLLSDIRRLWHGHFPDFRASATLVRTLACDGRPSFQVVFHPRSLRRAPKDPPPSPAGCALDAIRPDASLPFRNWIVTPNRFPVEEEHVLLVLRDHRAEIEAQDVLDGFAFAEETGYRLLLNLRDSGASIPEHLHWQCLLVDFPVFEDRCSGRPVLDTRNFQVHSLAAPWRGFRVDVRREDGRKRVAATLSAWKAPLNLVLTSSAVYVFPRAREFSPLFPGFKLGAAEVAGIMYPPTQAMFESVDGTSFAQAISDAVWNEGQERTALQKLSSLLQATV